MFNRRKKKNQPKKILNLNWIRILKSKMILVKLKKVIKTIKREGLKYLETIFHNTHFLWIIQKTRQKVQIYLDKYRQIALSIFNGHKINYLEAKTQQTMIKQSKLKQDLYFQTNSNYLVNKTTLRMETTNNLYFQI